MVVVVGGVEVEGEGLAARVLADAAGEARDDEGRAVHGQGTGHYSETGIGESRERHDDGRDGG